MVHCSLYNDVMKSPFVLEDGELNWKAITISLSVFFVLALVGDVVLWYSINKQDSAVATLNDIIAAQPPAPQTDEEKVALLESLSAARKAAEAEVRSKQPVQGVFSTTSAVERAMEPLVGSEPSAEDIQAKIQLMERLKNPSNR